MLLANQQHQPYFMHSQPTTIMVTNNSGVDPKPLITPGLRLMLPEGLLRTRFRM